MKRISASFKPSKGFAMIEILISMFVLSVGLLGILNLFLNGTKNTDAAFLRSEATILAYDLADRIRANPSATANYSLSAATTLATPANDCIQQSCDTVQLAQADLYDWKSQLAQALPSGDATIVIVPPVATITISWDNLGTQETYSIVSQ